MIKEVTYYDIICDRCGKSLTKESEMCYPDTESAQMDFAADFDTMKEAVIKALNQLDENEN